MESSELRGRLMEGAVIPAHPLALTEDRRLDERRQTALSRYYCDAGAGGVAVGVHTTQFSIRNPEVGLFKPVLQLAVATVREWERANHAHIVKVAGICGDTPQAIAEATLAHDLGFDAGLVSLGALSGSRDEDLVEHCRQLAGTIPLFGFYLQPAAGGRRLDYSFWRGFLEIENVVAVKVAPFNRYQTLDVVRALADSGRHGEIALYTGNDDNIVADLLSEFKLAGRSGEVALHFSGGLLGHWAVWTRRAVELLDSARECRRQKGRGAWSLLSRAAAITDSNAALFDPGHGFAGCIAGIHEVLRRQGLLAGRWCLDPAEDLSPGQMEEIDRIYRQYPELNDDEFVAENLDRWLT